MSGIVPSLDYPYQVIQVKGTSGNAKSKVEYVCESDPGAKKSDSVWRIRKFIYDSNGFNTQIIFADNSKQFNKRQDQHATYTYTISA